MIAKNQIQEDEIKKITVHYICTILKNCYHENLKENIKNELISNLLWKYSEAERLNSTNKIGIKKWSEKAIEEYQKESEVKNLIHEHAIPRKILVEWLINIEKEKVNNRNIYDFLEKYCFGIV